jgi:hypothetical protein
MRAFARLLSSAIARLRSSSGGGAYSTTPLFPLHWVPSPPYIELPPLASDPLLEMRVNKYSISEFRVTT